MKVSINKARLLEVSPDKYKKGTEFTPLLPDINRILEGFTDIESNYHP